MFSILRKEEFEKIKNLYWMPKCDSNDCFINWQFNIKEPTENFQRPTYINAVYRSLYFQLFKNYDFLNESKQATILHFKTKTNILRSFIEYKDKKTWKKLQQIVEDNND